MENLIKKSKQVTRNTSTEQLDIPLKLMVSKYWFIWGTLVVIVFFALLWSIFGEVHVRVDGLGIILPEPSNIYSAVTKGRSGGLVESVKVKEGDIVKEGEIIATINQDSLEKQIVETKSYLEKLKQERKAILGNLYQQEKMVQETTREYNKAIDVKREHVLKYKDFYVNYVRNQKYLQRTGAISTHTMEEQEKTLYDIEDSLAEIVSQKASHFLNMLTYAIQRTKEQASINLEILQCESKLKNLQIQLEESSIVKSPVHGFVNQINATKGDYVAPGTTIVTVVDYSKIDDVIAFFSPFDGKRIAKGMETFISPSITKKEKYGTMVGAVRTVSMYPLDFKAVSEILKDPELAKLMSKTGPPILTKIDLKKDPDSVSGYKWTSEKGPDFEITNGTLCRVSVMVEVERPITLLIPFLKKWILG